MPNGISTWTFDIAACKHLLICAALSLAACDGINILQPETHVTVANDSVTITGPVGYCIDRSATKYSNQGAFVLLGSCASIGNHAGHAKPQVSGALTASVSGESGAVIANDLQRLSQFFRSTAGRSALARDGNANSVRVLSTRRSGGAFLMKVRDQSPNSVSGLAPDYWRAVFDVRGRIVTLGVNAFHGKPISNADGYATLVSFVTQVRSENPPLVDLTDDPV